MNQTKSLLKAIMSQDMNLFKYKTKNTKKQNKIMFPLLLAIIFMCSIGVYYNLIGIELHKINLTYIMLTFAVIIPTIFILVEGIYKSQSILFETKDNDLLFSLPISKSKIVFVRIFKLLIFQYLYSLLFVLPGIIIYAHLENPNINFYIISFIMTILIPIIPTIISSFFGLLIKKISTKFKTKKLAQTILTLIFFLIFFYLSLNMNNLIENMIKNATTINNILSRIYYPVGLYINLILKFNFIELLKLIIINLIPLLIFIYITSKYYFKIITKSKETITKPNNTKIKIKRNQKLKSLIIKELKKYFSSNVYMFNTLIGLILIIIITIGMCINLEGLIKVITDNEEIGMSIQDIKILLPKIFLAVIVFTSCLTSITSSSISIEGRTINISKSLPITTKEIFLSKILFSNILVVSIITLCDIIFIIAFKIKLYDILTILLASITLPTLIAIIGLLINLKYPKMDATSDVEVIKQSASSMISVFLGLIISIILITIPIILKNKLDLNITILIELTALILITITLWIILQTYGTKKYKEINI